jgi:4-aminobutyrate aminotransferase apoenzyme (EC 2.6.1.19)
VAAANAVLDVIEDEGLLSRAEVIGAAIKARLNAIAARPGGAAIAEVRGLGAMVAFELVSDPATLAAAPDLTNRIVAEAEARGLIILACGTRGNVIRLLPALTIPDSHLAEALDILDATLATLLTPAEALA